MATLTDMAECAAVGCAEPVLEVWRPTAEDAAPRFYYLVCPFHSLALKSGATYTVTGEELHVDNPDRLRDWNLTESGGQAIVQFVYGDDLDTTDVTFQADPAMLIQIAKSITSMYGA
jgi:hypothetical protein